jgi:hypothetical protein
MIRAPSTPNDAPPPSEPANAPYACSRRNPLERRTTRELRVWIRRLAVRVPPGEQRKALRSVLFGDIAGTGTVTPAARPPGNCVAQQQYAVSDLVRCCGRRLTGRGVIVEGRDVEIPFARPEVSCRGSKAVGRRLFNPGNRNLAGPPSRLQPTGVHHERSTGLGDLGEAADGEGFSLGFSEPTAYAGWHRWFRCRRARADHGAATKPDTMVVEGR